MMWQTVMLKLMCIVFIGFILFAIMGAVVTVHGLWHICILYNLAWKCHSSAVSVLRLCTHCMSGFQLFLEFPRTF